LFNKNQVELLNTSIAPEKQMKLSWYDDYKKIQKYYLSFEVAYQVQSKKRIYVL